MFDLISRRNISVKIGLFFHEIAFITEFPSRNLLLSTFSQVANGTFQGVNLLLATVNFEPCSMPSYLELYMSHFLPRPRPVTTDTAVQGIIINIT